MYFIYVIDQYKSFQQLKVKHSRSLYFQNSILPSTPFHVDNKQQFAKYLSNFTPYRTRL